MKQWSITKNGAWLAAAGLCVFLLCCGGGGAPSPESDGDTDQAGVDEQAGDECTEQSDAEGDDDTDDPGEATDETHTDIIDLDEAEEAGDYPEDGAQDDEPETDTADTPGAVCIPGQQYCHTSQKLMRCDDDGLAWRQEFCGVTAWCLDDRCVPWQCDPGQRSCSGQAVTACDDDGLLRTIDEVCDTGSRCRDGACIDLCAQAAVLTPGQVVEGSTVGSDSLFNISSRCFDPAGADVASPGGDALYQLSLEQGQAVTLSLASLTRHFDPALFVLDACDLQTPACVAGADACCSGVDDVLTFTAPRTASYWVVVDSWQALDGAFRLLVEDGQPQGVDLAVTDLLCRYDLDAQRLDITAILANQSPVGIPWADLDLLQVDDPAQGPEDGRLFDRISVAGLGPGESREVTLSRLRPARGVLHLHAVADLWRRLYDPWRENNAQGPVSVTIDSAIVETPLTPPQVWEGRIQDPAQEDFYRYPCQAGEIIRVAVEPTGLATLAPRLRVFELDRVTLMEERNPRQPETVAYTVHCASGGDYRLQVSASVTAPDEARTGAYTLTLAPLAAITPSPAYLRMFPGAQATVAVTGRFAQDLLPPADLDPESLSWRNLSPAVMDVTPPGTVTALTQTGEAFASVALLTDMPEVAAAYFTVEVRHTIPGDIYVADDPFPLGIPDGQNSLISFIYVDDPTIVAQVYVAVSITHAAAAQVEISLISPLGVAVTLRKSGEAGLDILAVYGVTQRPSGPGGLEDFAGQSPQGQWRLVVRDVTEGVNGRLNAWRLYLSPGPR